MIEIINPGMLALIVDQGRYGYCAIGIPYSSALDQYALSALNHILVNDQSLPAIEVIGKGFSLKFNVSISCAITGAKVRAYLDDRQLPPWTSFTASPGSVLRVEEVLEGFRYYIGFAGVPELEKIVNSYTTNLECCFGGYEGRPLKTLDRINFSQIRKERMNLIPDRFIPKMKPPHSLRVLPCPETGYFTEESLERITSSEKRTVFTVSAKSNRTGIRLTGEPLTFRKEASRSIISEGILPGTIQIPGDGIPIIQLYERTIGGYARMAIVAKVDHDLLAHLQQDDYVLFNMISMEEAEDLWRKKLAQINRLS
jgi:antagonist of KipI